MTPVDNNDDQRCIYRSPRGFRCRNNSSLPHTSLCHRHMRDTVAYAAAQEIVSNQDRLDTAEGVHALLARTTLALAHGHIQPRRATAMAYMCQTLHVSVDRLRNERERVFARTEEEAHHEKALQDSQHDNLVCENDALNSAFEDELAEKESSENGRRKK